VPLRAQKWSFSGPFGNWDKAQLQRGLKVYREVCSVCHGLKFVAFRNLADLGFSEGQIKTISVGIQDPWTGRTTKGEMFERDGRFPA